MLVFPVGLLLLLLLLLRPGGALLSCCSWVGGPASVCCRGCQESVPPATLCTVLHLGTHQTACHGLPACTSPPSHLRPPCCQCRYQLTTLQSGLVVSLSLAGALIGSVAALIFGDRLGRRRELLAAAGLYAAGSVAVAVAPGLGVLLAGRLAYGVGIGFAMHAAPAYIAETSPARVRGLLISLKEAFIVGGILAG